MTENTENKNLPVTRQAKAVQGRSAKGRVSGKLAAALNFMTWQGLKRDEAATKAGLTDDGLRRALKKPHVKAAYLAECEVLRVSGRARRIHRLEALTEQDENKQAAVNAARALDLMGNDAAATVSTGQRAGITIVILPNPNQPSSRTIGPAQSQADDGRVIEHEAADTSDDVTDEPA